MSASKGSSSGSKGYTLRSDGRYQGYWRELDKNGQPTGQRHAIYGKTPKELFAKIREKETPRRETFRKVAEEWKDIYIETISDRTWKNYIRIFYELIEDFGNESIEDINGADVNRILLRAKAQHYSHTVINSYRVVMNGVFNYAVEQRYINFNPALNVKLPKSKTPGTRRAPTDEEIKTILQNVNAPFGFFPFLLICTGLRKGEALALLKTDVDLVNKKITVNKSVYYPYDSKPVIKEPKSEAGNREVPIIDALIEPLKRYMRSFKSDYMFPHIEYRKSKKNSYMMKYNYDIAWKHYCEYVGFVDAKGNPTIGAHNLRHGTATLFFESNVDAKTAQIILGHSSLAVTLGIYTELRDKQKSKSVESFGNVMSNLLSEAASDTDNV